MPIDNFKQLIVWRRAIELVKEVYKLTQLLPTDERYGLVSQMRRCAVSIPSNIAEGCKRGARGEYVHFLGIAQGSAAELETQIIIVQEVHQTIDCGRANSLLTEVQKMLNALKRRLNPTP